MESKGPNGLPVPNPRVTLTLLDESLAKIFAAHQKALRKAKTVPAPTDTAEAVRAWERFLTVAFGTRLATAD
jgi:hypothetical protein